MTTAASRQLVERVVFIRLKSQDLSLRKKGLGRKPKEKVPWWDGRVLTLPAISADRGRPRAQRLRWGRGAPLGIPAVRDRTVEATLRNDFAESSYGFRPGRGCREAAVRVEELLGQGHAWCVDCDLKIPHAGLMVLVKQRVVDGSVLAMLEQCLKAGVLEELKGWQPTEKGAPQGAVISPLPVNLYLNPLEHELERRGWKLVRYADDFVVLCRTQEEAQKVLEELRQWTTEAGLTLHPTKTRIVHAPSEGFDFLGWHAIPTPIGRFSAS